MKEGKGYEKENLYYTNDTIDSYEQVAMVDAWQKELVEKDYQGNPFPADIDVNNDGIIYYIMKNGAKELSIPYVNLAEENIRSIK